MISFENCVGFLYLSVRCRQCISCAIGRHANIAHLITEFECMDHLRRIDATKRFCDPESDSRKKTRLLRHMVFELIVGENIDDHVKSILNDAARVRSVFIQSVFALCEFYERFDVCHGDIASDNIIVSIDDKLTTVTYNVSGKHLRVKTLGFVVKFIDFERALIDKPSFTDFMFDLTTFIGFFERWTGCSTYKGMTEEIKQCTTMSEIIHFVRDATRR